MVRNVPTGVCWAAPGFSASHTTWLLPRVCVFYSSLLFLKIRDAKLRNLLLTTGPCQNGLWRAAEPLMGRTATHHSVVVCVGRDSRTDADTCINHEAAGRRRKSAACDNKCSARVLADQHLADRPRPLGAAPGDRLIALNAVADCKRRLR